MGAGDVRGGERGGGRAGRELLFPRSLLPIAASRGSSCPRAGSPHPLPAPPAPPGRSAGGGEADAVVAPVEFGVVVADEGGAQDPEGTGRRGDVQPGESHHAHVLAVLGLLRRGDPRGEGGGGRRRVPASPCAPAPRPLLGHRVPSSGIAGYPEQGSSGPTPFPAQTPPKSHPVPGGVVQALCELSVTTSRCSSAHPSSG